MIMVEAGGIEPPSRDSVGAASTFMSHYLFLARCISSERDTRGASPNLFRLEAYGRPLKGYPTAVTPLPGLAGQAGAGSCIYAASA